MLSAEQLPFVWLGGDDRVFRDVAYPIVVAYNRIPVACIVDHHVVLGKPSLLFQLLDWLVFFVLFLPSIPSTFLSRLAISFNITYLY